MSLRDLPLSLRFALRELRGGLSGFRIFVACIAVGVAAIAGINSVSQALTQSIAAEGRVILGGDLAFSLMHRRMTAEEASFLASRGELREIATLRAMLRRADETNQALVELKAVDGAYPHGGELVLEDGRADPEVELAARSGVYGALVAPELLDRLALRLGDRVLLGSQSLEVRGVIRTEPDRLSSGLGFGPRLLVSLDALEASGLLRPGSLVSHVYRLALPAGEQSRQDIRQVRREANRLFPEAGWSIRTRTNASPALTRNIERFTQFLTLVGLTALVVGGVGVANAVSSFVDLKRPAIATLKCLGATAETVFRVYLWQILILALVGIAIGVGTGALMPFAARSALADLVPVSAFGVYPLQLSLAVLYGLLVTLAFALGPLGRARQMPAASLFADRALGSSTQPPLAYRLAQGIALLSLAGLAIGLAGDRRLAFFYLVAVALAFVVLRLVAILIMKLASRARTIRRTTLRLAIRNIHSTLR